MSELINELKKLKAAQQDESCSKKEPFIKLGKCVGLSEQETFWRIRKNIKDTWRADEGGLEISVNGPILNVTTNTLRTDSVVVDALLGQGERWIATI